MPNIPAVVLLSGGLDSATVLAIAHAKNRACYALSFRYGQRHLSEIEAAYQIAKKFNVKEHLVLEIPLNTWGGSALTGDLEVPKNRDYQDAGDTPPVGAGLAPALVCESPIPITYVPARNTVFLALALAWAEVLHAQEIWIGVNALDYSGYPDCRPEFIKAFEELARLGTKAGVEGTLELKIMAPLQYLSKAEIIRTGTQLGVDYSLTRSCYDPPAEGIHCGQCDACHLRRKGFIKAGIPDPTRYWEDLR
jgi:7-cyano-7-deazaguanine synthase